MSVLSRVSSCPKHSTFGIEVTSWRYHKYLHLTLSLMTPFGNSFLATVPIYPHRILKEKSWWAPVLTVFEKTLEMFNFSAYLSQGVSAARVESEGYVCIYLTAKQKAVVRGPSLPELESVSLPVGGFLQ